MKHLRTIERMWRLLLGDALAVRALWLFRGGQALVWRPLYVALVALGMDFHCDRHPRLLLLYQRLGWSTARLRALDTTRRDGSADSGTTTA